MLLLNPQQEIQYRSDTFVLYVQLKAIKVPVTPDCRVVAKHLDNSCALLFFVSHVMLSLLSVNTRPDNNEHDGSHSDQSSQKSLLIFGVYDTEIHKDDSQAKDHVKGYCNK